MKSICIEIETHREHREKPRANPYDTPCYTDGSNLRQHPAASRRGHISKYRSLEIEVEAEKHVELRGRLVAAVRSVCPAWLLDRQDDLVQTAMLAVLKQEEKLEHPRDFPASYLRLAAYTAMVDEIRWLRSRREVPIETEEMPATASPEHENPERQTLSNEISRSVRSCLQLLAPSRRVAVSLHLLSYNVPQIAERLQWKRKQAENLVYRGLGNLRQCLESKGIQP